MHHFSVNPSGFESIRMKTIRVVLLIFAVIIAISLILLYVNRGAEASANTMPYLMIVFAIIFILSSLNALNRRRKIFQSFKITITENSVIREQLNTPTLTMEINDVREIVKYSGGQLVIMGRSKLNPIVVPAQMDNADELERLLSGIIPITVKKSHSWIQYGILLSAVVAMILLFMGFGSDIKFVSVSCGAALCVVILWAFVMIQRSKNVDKRLRRISYVSLIPFVSILAVTVMKVMA